MHLDHLIFGEHLQAHRHQVINDAERLHYCGRLALSQFCWDGSDGKLAKVPRPTKWMHLTPYVSPVYLPGDGRLAVCDTDFVAAAYGHAAVS